MMLSYLFKINGQIIVIEVEDRIKMLLWFNIFRKEEVNDF